MERKFSLTETYGSLDEYLRFIDMTIDDLIKMKQGEIVLLQSRYDKLAQHNEELNDEGLELARHISGVLHKKREMLDRFIRWKIEYERKGTPALMED